VRPPFDRIPLQLPESRRDRQPCGTQCRQQASDQAEYERIDEPVTSRAGVTVKAKVIWLKLAQLSVEAW